jgi:uncharacterized membrane-anchored protein
MFRRLATGTALSLFTLLLLSVAPSASAAEQPDPAAEEAKRIVESVKWTNGPGHGNLKVAAIDVPEGYIFASDDDVRKLMELMHNPTSGREVGFLSPADMSWFAVFEFSDTGYVKDDDGNKLDADALLKSIREANEEGNKERAKRGWGPFNVKGWERPPNYNPSTHNLEWAIRGESEGETIINYNTRILGRRGVMEVSLVVDPPVLASTLPVYEKLLTRYDFNGGERYAEFKQGDKMAEYGLAALITGGAAVAAVKTGFFAKIFKFLGKGIIAIVAAAGALWKKLFSRDPADSRNASHD